MADRDQHSSREDEIRHAVFDQVDLQTAELEIVRSIYDGFAAAIMVKGQPRTVALTREYGDAVQLMALIERGRTALFALPGDGASLADHVYCPPGLSCPPIAEAASKPQGCGAIYAAAYDSIRKGAPGLSDATCAVIARSINMKAALSAQAQPRDEAQPVRGEIRVIDGNRCRFIERELEGDKWEVIGPVVVKETAAPVREEGGAVETAVKIATDLHHTYEQLIYGLPKYLEAENLTDEENMIREAWITLDVTAHRLAALATREEAPAEAGAVTHSEACHYADTSGDPLISMARTAWQRLEGEQPDVHAASVTLHGLMLALAYEALCAQPQAREEAQPVGRIVSCFASGLGEMRSVEWASGRVPDVGTALYTTPPAPEAEKLRVAVEAIRAEIRAPLSGPMHGAWDRGRIAGLKEALAALQQEGRDRG